MVINMLRHKRIVIIAICTMLIVSMLCGCSRGMDEAGQTSGEGQQQGSAGDYSMGGFVQDAASENVAMGRYVEEATDLSELGYQRSSGITKLNDGTLVILDYYSGKIVSRDNGETWKAESGPIDFAAFGEENYIMDLKIGPDGTIAVLYSAYSSEELDSFLLLIKPDGSQNTIDIPVTGDEKFVSTIWFSPDNELYAVTVGGDNIYLIDQESGSTSKYLTVVRRPDLMQFQNHYMITVNSETGILCYDMENKAYQEDQILVDFMKENYQQEYYMGDTYSVFCFPGEDGILYVAGKKGLHRHVIGGSAMEQVVDGNLSSFSDPSLSIVGMLALDNNEFLALFSGGKLVRYVYDATIPTIPNERVTVYSLKDMDSVRQVISLYQTAHPEAYVEYVVGMDGESSITREDAIKNLNTQILAGEGPDVLVLDGLPIDSYKERGMLLDLSPYVQEMTGDAALFPNIIQSFTEGDQILMLPALVQIPTIVARQEDLAGISDVASFADKIEELRSQNPGKEIIGLFSELAAIEWFLPLSAPDWKDGAGGIKDQVISDYLYRIKRIYDACQEGISQRLKDLYDYRAGLYLTTDRSFNDVSMNNIEYAQGNNVFLAGLLDGTYSYHQIISLKHIAGMESTQVRLLPGDMGNVFVPGTLAGISAVSAHQEQAAEFIRIMFGKEAQELLGGDGGFPVNQEAMKIWLGSAYNTTTYEKQPLGEPYSSISVSTQDGEYFGMDIYMPSEEEAQELYDMISSVNVPYIRDSVLDDAVIQEGGAYLLGQCSLEQTMSNIEARVALYMAE